MSLLNFIGVPFVKPRLLIPLISGSGQALSFNLYNPGSKYGQVMKYWGQKMAQLGIMKICSGMLAQPLEKFKTTNTISPILKNDVFVNLQNTWGAIIGEESISVAISLGGANHYRKVTTLLFNQQAKPVAFAKIAVTKQAKGLIANEWLALNKVYFMNFKHAIISTPLAYDYAGPTDWLLQTVLLGGRPSPNSLLREHVDFLSELFNATKTLLPLKSWKCYNFIMQASAQPILNTILDKSERSFILQILKELRESDLIYGPIDWPFGAAHGDFAPWNLRINNGKIELFDWEYFLPLAPYGWDLLYFIFRVEQLIKKKKLQDVWKTFKSGSYYEILKKCEGSADISIPDIKHLAMLVIVAIALDLTPNWLTNNRTI